TGLRVRCVQLDEIADGATIHGGPIGHVTINRHGDHRIAMAFSIAGHLSVSTVRIEDVANVVTSFPDYETLARSAGFCLE
ncbi:3-phosphoshikimate 1-carboxyvinyltransferase, partial [Xylella fastidiosa subsp. multiplex]|nr:3-phosphoshikimate 1-carboxyvinyltransferase [Xylella fastidiosa subsp. multiplex]